MIMHKFNIMNKKWVGLLLTFILSMNIIIKNFDVYAEAEKKGYCSGASAKFSMKSSENGEKLKNVSVDLGNGKYSIWLVPENLIDDADLSDSSNTKLRKIANKAIKGTGSQNIANGVTNEYLIKHSFVSQKPYTVNGVSDFYVIVMLEVEENDPDCGYWLKIEHVTHDNQISNAPIDKTTANKQACDWATSFVNTVDSRMATLVKKAMAPCFGSSYNMSKENLNKIKKSLEYFYNNTYKKFASSTTGDNSYTAFSKDLPALDAKWKEIKDTKKVDYKALGANSNSMLTCSTKNEKTFQYLYHIETKNINADITLGDDIVAKQTTTTKKVCGTKCRETLTISYGPPVAVIAGQCFTYEVEVKSNVECVVTGLGGDGNGGNGDDAFNNFPDINNYVPCEIYPYCYGSNGVPAGGAGYTNQAGPTEDFDSCISSCDGGKYSQKCIDSCYNAVYNKKAKDSKSTKKSSTKKTSAFDATSTDNKNYNDLVKSSGLTIDEINRKIYSIDTITLATRMGLLSGGSVGGSDCPGGDPLADSSVINKVYEYVNDNITGKYYMNGSTISYTAKNNTSCEWNKYGYYYFRDKSITARTVCNAYGYSWNWGSTTCSPTPSASCRAGNGCYRGRPAGTGHYYPDSNGFKRSTVCQETCEWVNSGKSYTGGSCYYLDKGNAESDYVNNVNKYIDALTKCIEAVIANCNTETTNFTIAVNNDVETGADKQKCDSGNYDSNGNCIRKDDNNQSNTFIDNTQLEFNRILKYNGGTCSSGFNNSGSGTKTDMYHSIITFPGAWINNKNGEVIYDKPDGSNSWYTSKIGNYCTPLTAKNVNAHWWTWYQYYKSGTTNKTFDEWAGSKSKDITYNIFAKINDFGKYNWDLNAGCFYAANDYTPTCEGDSCDPVKPVCEFPGGCDNIPNGCVGKSCSPCTGSSCEPNRKTPIDNYTTKAISPKTMFPQTKTSSLSTQSVSPTRLSYVDKMADAAEGKRTEGFNWSVNATNLSIAGYPVTPSTLVKKIENSNVYDDSEVDYEINLTKEQIRKIKNEAKDSKFSYTSYSNGKYEEIKGDSAKYLAIVKTDNTKKYTENTIPSFKYYRSDYIRSHGATKYPSDNGLSCNNIASGGNGCDITLGGRTNSDDELISFLSSAQSIR